MNKPTEIVATLGDPSSIGPQVAARALQALDWDDTHKIHIVGSKSSLEHYLGKSVLKSFLQQDRLEIHDLEKNAEYLPGKGDKVSGKRALDDLNFAVKILQENQWQALVTGPVDKYLCSLTEPQFKGQTEYLKSLTKSEGVTMLLSGPHLRVCLVTTHLALKDVPKAITTDGIIESSLRLIDYLHHFHSQPSIAVCALNPHASDNGLFGDEEEKIIRPAVRHLSEKGIKVEGPLPADSLFYRAAEYDGIVCMYHDQALIPLKMQDFYEAVNISLGLGFLRVSVDHGTAFDLVGSENVSSLSYQRALEQALAWAERSR